jgi:dihydrodipicolinate synthase/N-acetylneuraminate lyase
MQDYEKIKKELRGPAVLIQTPFKQNYDLDLEALKENINYVIEEGIVRGKGFIICPCGTGEYVALSKEEHYNMIKTAVDTANDRLPVVAGVASCYYKEAIELAKNAEKAGADCIMIPPPYYYSIDQAAIIRWYKIVAEETNIPIMAYNQWWRNLGTYFTIKTMGEFARMESIVSLKYGGEVMTDYIMALSLFSKRFAFIDNSLAYTAAIGHMHGASGYITGPACFWPEFEVKYWNLLEEKRYQDAELWHARLSPFWEFYFHGGGELKGEEFEAAEGTFFPAAVFKAAMEYVGLKAGPVRPPFRSLTDEEKNRLFKILEKIGVKKRK